MVRSVEPENAAAFWDARYAEARLYGTEPVSVARRLGAPWRTASGASPETAG